jgi:tetratricopeptide (TPR) repeat protein
MIHLKRSNCIWISIFLFFYSILFSSLHFAISLKEAETHYQQKHYTEAEKIYLSINEKDASPALLYNLGNTFFKQQSLGKALFYYQKAQLKSPRDGDIIHNIAVVQSRLSVSTNPPSFLEKLSHYTSLNETYGFLLISFFIFLCAISAYILKPHSFFKQTAYVFLGLGISASLFLSVQLWIWSDKKAVVLQDETPLKSEPMQADIVKLKAGTLCQVLQKKNNWIEVKINKNQRGWLFSDTVGLFP